ncbi:hypothetical protein NN3_61310 [Nocardia neocaledoniensis NBRC 108232]|nr:hypothetical protein NN3_61310 [Nocardia neocaledoniensis NBRC 108232]
MIRRVGISVRSMRWGVAAMFSSMGIMACSFRPGAESALLPDGRARDIEKNMFLAQLASGHKAAGQTL